MIGILCKLGRHKWKGNKAKALQYGGGLAKHRIMMGGSRVCEGCRNVEILHNNSEEVRTYWLRIT